MTKTTNTFGELGERIAERWLESHGYTMLARRWRSGHRDIDLIATRDGVVMFVEVKTRAAVCVRHHSCAPRIIPAHRGLSHGDRRGTKDTENGQTIEGVWRRVLSATPP